MKITINRESFLSVFQIASMVAPSRSPKTILEYVKLSVQPKSVVLTATDMEIEARLDVPDVQVDTPGDVVIPVARLSLILRESTDDQLSIELVDDKVQIKGSNSKFELNIRNVDEFPEVDTSNKDGTFEVSSGALKEVIRRTIFATDAESGRYALGGILIEFEEDQVIAVATDGRRLAKMSAGGQLNGDLPNSDSPTIVPSKTMNLIERVLGENEDKVQLSPRSNDLVLNFPKGTIYSRLVEGKFPKWRDVIPKRASSHKLEIPVGPMYTAIRQAAIVASSESRGIDFTFDSGTLSLDSNTAEVGTSHIQMPVPYDAEKLTITLDHRFFGDFLRVLEPEKTFTLDIEATDKAAYCVTDDGYSYVIMPLSKERRGQ